ncbi:hypothetical protein Tco_0627713 [Tanacetum coccineum]|uniref:Reverse transcriptase domain-containing protein n=1 Tax=Tanacetum coccineum TaxID=301880 RepID=A0ABQ4WN88_9ASTR
MSQPVEQTQTPANSAVRNTMGKGSKQAPDNNPGYLPADKLREICEKHYNQILPIMAEKVHQKKLQGVQTRLNFEESSRQHSPTRGKTIFSESKSCDRQRRARKKRRSSPAFAPKDTYYSQNTSIFSRIRREGAKPTRQRSPVSTTVFTRLGDRDRNVFQRLGERKKRHTLTSWARSHAAMQTCKRKKKRYHRQIQIEREWDEADRANRRRPIRIKGIPLTEDEDDQSGH